MTNSWNNLVKSDQDNLVIFFDQIILVKLTKFTISMISNLPIKTCTSEFYC